MDRLPLEGKVALVTGAATGIGRATAMGLARAGVQVWVNHLGQHEAAEQLCAEIESHGGQVRHVEADVGSAAAVAGMFEQILADGPLDLLVNNAGIILEKPFLDTTEQDWAQVLGVDLHGVYHCCQHALRHMQPRSCGAIVNVASDLGFLGRSDSAAYCPAKAAVIGLTKSVAVDYIKQGIRCNAICPGTVESPSWHDRVKALGEELGSYDTALEQFVSRQPMGRVATAREIASLVTYLASDESGFTTGHPHVIDGGWSGQ